MKVSRVVVVAASAGVVLAGVGLSGMAPASVTPQASAAGVRAVRVATPSVFVTPSGNIACMFEGTARAAQPTSVWCQILTKTYTGVKPTICPNGVGTPAAWSDRNVVLVGTRRAQFACRSPQGLAPAAALRFPDGKANSLVSWRLRTDPVVASPGGPRAALAYGSSMTWGAVRCTVTAANVTCTNSATKHAFMLSRDAFTLS